MPAHHAGEGDNTLRQSQSFHARAVVQRRLGQRRGNSHLFLAGVFATLPEAVLGAVVIHAPWGSIRPTKVTALRAARVPDFWLALVALLGVLLIGILAGVVLGVACPTQTHRPDHRRLPHRRGDRGPARRTRPRDLAWAARPCPARPGCPDRATGQRAHRPAHHRRPTRRCSPRPLPWQGAQGPRHPNDSSQHQDPARLAGRRATSPGDALFPTRTGRALSTDAVALLLAKHTAAAARTCPSLNSRRITPHTLRHSAAVALLQAGVDTSVIALWLGHEQTATTLVYLHVDLQTKQQALARVRPPDDPPGRYKPPDDVIAFLDPLTSTVDYAERITRSTPPDLGLRRGSRDNPHLGIRVLTPMSAYVLQPHPRLGDPRAVDPGVAQPPRGDGARQHRRSHPRRGPNRGTRQGKRRRVRQIP